MGNKIDFNDFEVIDIQVEISGKTTEVMKTDLFTILYCSFAVVLHLAIGLGVYFFV